VFSSLMKHNKKAKICFVICFAEKKNIILYLCCDLCVFFSRVRVFARKSGGRSSMADSARELLREVRNSITHTCRPPTVNPKKKISKTGPKVRQPQQSCCPLLFAVSLGPVLLTLWQCTQWMEDKYAKNCCACGFQFNLLVRRHHCRYALCLSLPPALSLSLPLSLSPARALYPSRAHPDGARPECKTQGVRPAVL
jgi:hypothetical protein